MSINVEQVRAILSDYQDPFLGHLINAKVISTIEVHSHQIVIDVVLGFAAANYKVDFSRSLRTFLEEKIKGLPIVINVRWNIEPKAVQPNVKSVTQIKNIIAVASGKGGVGKSTTAVNVALALAAEEANVGILDADIYGPNQPCMLGVKHASVVDENRRLQPVLEWGLQSMSMGYLVNETTPMIWRGPMVTTALLQLLNDTQWKELDYLIIDLPPGTGDIQLTLAQKIPVAGAIIVTTPQDVALLDARKGIEMFRKVNIPVLGIVENMSMHHCSKCGHKSAIFGEGGGLRIAEEYGVSLLGQLPLDARIREFADKGQPIVIADPESTAAKMYSHIALNVAARLSLQNKNFAAKFPTIVVET